ncbi:MAG: 50S ribosomal protein L2 [Rickettsiales bacterium]|jgi:large subunit ribosomal protein L2|nr:50S ribosomal protein L2 [Rickettsiales bacterium]
MAMKTYNPVTPSLRETSLVDKSALHKGGPVKSLTVGIKKTGGRNNKGHQTNRNMGGGARRRYRVIDFKRAKRDMPATVERIEYDPNRTAFIALIKYEDGGLAYILAPQKLVPGAKVVAGEKADIQIGNALPLRNIPMGTIIHNIEMKPGHGGQLARSAGCYASLAGKDGGYAQIKMSSGELRVVPGDCYASIGAVSNPDQRNVNLGKAGRSAWKGRRPHVRGTAMNPVDHPHGGGEGRTFGRHPVSPTGQPTKGYRTRTNKLTGKFILRSRHLNKKK